MVRFARHCGISEGNFGALRRCHATLARATYKRVECRRLGVREHKTGFVMARPMVPTERVRCPKVTWKMELPMRLPLPH